MTIATTAFDAIRARLEDRKGDLLRLAATGSSFEEWLTCEAYIACSTRWKHTGVKQRPRYASVGVDENRFGDLVVHRKLQSLLVEIGIIHGGTGSKQDRKIDADMVKIASIQLTQARQIVVVEIGEPDRAAVVREMIKRRILRFEREAPHASVIRAKGRAVHLFGWTEHSPI
jgi:hypothetical protein